VARSIAPLRPPSPLLRRLLRAPIALYRLGLGGLLGRRFLLLEHVGRRTGRLRHTVLEVVRHDAVTDAYFVAVGFGPRSDWYRNLEQTPECVIQTGRRHSRRRASTLAPAEGADLLADYAARHPVAARGLVRFMGYEVDGTESDYRDVAARLSLRFVKLELVRGLAELRNPGAS
jgi:deazaflavin-dependent oxidoreductase (nitroreductase family)